MNKVEQILEEFDKLDFSEFEHEKDMVKFTMLVPEKIKGFIRTQLNSLLEEVAVEINGKKRLEGALSTESLLWRQGHNKGIEKAVEIIRSYKSQ